jgi:type I restriction enzyme S subunit
MSTDKNKLIPELRFPEFADEREWVEKELGKLAKKIVEKNRDGFTTKVFTNSASYGIVDQREYFDKDIADKNNLENYYVVEPDDYVYNPRISNIAPVGPTSKNKTDLTGAMSPLYTVFRFTAKNNSFYEYYFKSVHWYNSIRKASNTGARFDRMSITDSVFMDIPVLYPIPQEQQKIASCLSSLDEVIAAQSQKLATLKDHKKGLMQNLFPTNSITNDELEITNVPNYRFPEFLEDEGWVEKKLGDKEVSYFVNEKTSVDKLNVNSYVSTENMLPEFSGVSTSSKLPSLGNFTKFKNGDILISNIRPYLKKVWKADKIGGASNDVLVFRYGSEVLSEFLECIIKNEAFINYVMEGAKGVKMPRGDKDYMQKYIVFIPSKMEQQKIASCLSSLDDLITAQVEKIAQLKLHKKGLMQGLFPKSITN